MHQNYSGKKKNSLVYKPFSSIASIFLSLLAEAYYYTSVYKDNYCNRNLALEMLRQTPASAACVERLSALGYCKAETQKIMYRMPDEIQQAGDLVKKIKMISLSIIVNLPTAKKIKSLSCLIRQSDEKKKKKKKLYINQISCLFICFT